MFWKSDDPVDPVDVDVFVVLVVVDCVVPVKGCPSVVLVVVGCVLVVMVVNTTVN